MSVRAGGRAWSLIVIVGGLLITLTACGSGQTTVTAQPSGATFYYNQGRRIPVDVSADQVGIVAWGAAAQADVVSFAQGFNLRFARAYDSRIFVFRLQTPAARLDVVKQMRNIVQRGANIVKYAGLVVTPAGAESPLILSDEFIAQFKPQVSPQDIDKLNRDNGVQVVRPDRFAAKQFLLRVTDASSLDALDMANRYQDSGLTTFAEPNFARVVEHNSQASFIPNDPMFANQWHHQNTGQSGGTVDADVDTPLAWAITKGAPEVIIAVIDGGFDLAHEDLAPNLWVNPGEIPGNNVDDDGNGFVDDVKGWDFTDDDGDPSPGSSNPNHGTAVAGVAAARGDNGVGVSGACPHCRLMFIREGTTFQDDADTISYATKMGAAVITNSWSYPNGTAVPTGVVNAIKAAATSGRGGLGSIVLFAMLNHNVNDCAGGTTGVPGVQALDEVIAVSGSTNNDKKVTETGFGNCLGVLAPTFKGYGPAGAFTLPFTGTLNMVTTDRTGSTGYNTSAPSGPPSYDPAYCPAQTANLNYTMCFGGTSAATPLAGGIAALVLAANPTLTMIQVKRLLQDTADRIQDSLGAYASATGFSTPASGAATHGWGRVNAFEAVRTVAPAAQGGRGGADLFIRDNRLDWGNTEQPSTLLFEPVRGSIPVNSDEVRVDAPPFLVPGPGGLSAAFETFVNEVPKIGQVNHVYVRVRNRGPVAATAVTIKLLVSVAAGMPSLPADFWSAFPGNSTNVTTWRPLPCSTSAASAACTIPSVPYSGASVAGCPGRTVPSCGGASDGARVVSFDLQPPAAGSGVLLAVVDSMEDHAGPLTRTPTVDDFKPGTLVPSDNNVTFRVVSTDPSQPTPSRPTGMRLIR